MNPSIPVKKNRLAMVQTAFVVASVVLIIVSSAIAVAHNVYKSRQYFSELQKLEKERVHLQAEWGRLLLEQHTWGAYSRVGRIASEQLSMRNPAPTEIIMVRQ